MHKRLKLTLFLLLFFIDDDIMEKTNGKIQNQGKTVR